MTLTQSFLGMCLDRNAILAETKLTENDFTDPVEQQTFSEMKRIMLDGGQPDIISLKHAGVDVRFLSSLDIQISGGWRGREMQIIEASKKRQILRLAEKIKSSESLPAKDLIEMIAHEMGNVDRRGENEMHFIHEVADKQIEDITKRGDSCGNMKGLKTGFELLDFFTLGFQKKRLYYIGGRPSQGKTSLLVNFAINCKSRFGFLSAESDEGEIVIKMFAKYGHVDSRKLEMGTKEAGAFSVMSQFISEEYDRKSVIYDKSNMNIEDLCFMARNMVENYGVEILFVDYIQILEASFAMKKRDRREQIADISMKLKQLARDLNVPVVVAAQLTRSADKEQPDLGSFGETSQIEKDADVAILIWKRQEERFVESNGVKNKFVDEKCSLLIGKNRAGQTGKVDVEFDGATQSFTQLKKY